MLDSEAAGEAQIVRRRCWRPRITPKSEHHTMLHPLVRASRSISIRRRQSTVERSSSTLLCCAAKRVRTASGCGEAAAELRACARGDVCGGSSGRVASPNSPNTASGTKYECILTRRRGGSRHGTHTNGTTYIRGTYSRVQNTHKHTQTHTNTHKKYHTQRWENMGHASGFMRLCNITEKGRMVAQSGIITAMCNRYSVDITPVTHVISQGCNIHAHDIPVGTVILHPAPYTIVPGPGRDTRHPPHYHHPAA